MIDLINRLTKNGAWLFDPFDKNQPLGFVTKASDETGDQQYLITWYYDSKTTVPSRMFYDCNGLIGKLKPYYNPNSSNYQSNQVIPVCTKFVKDNYPDILKNHLSRASFFDLPTSVVENPTAKTIKALYAYILEKEPSLRNLYKNSKELLDMIIDKYKEESPRGEEACPCCGRY